MVVSFFIRVRKIFSAVILRRVGYGIFNNWTDESWDTQKKFHDEFGLTLRLYDGRKISREIVLLFVILLIAFMKI